MLYVYIDFLYVYSNEPNLIAEIRRKFFDSLCMYIYQSCKNILLLLLYYYQQFSVQSSTS